MAVARLPALLLAVLCSIGLLVREAGAYQGGQEKQANQDAEISLETRVVKLTPESGKLFMALAGFQNNQMGIISGKHLNAVLEFSQSSQSTDLIQAPTITVRSGEKANISMSDGIKSLNAGLVAKIQPMLLDNGKVFLEMEVDYTSAGNSQTAQGRNRQHLKSSAVVDLAVEQTLVVHLSREEHEVFVLVTPRVVAREATQKKTAQDQGRQMVVTYSVADLVGGTNAVTSEDNLVRLITNTIAPASWSDVGGQGTIQYFPFGKALVISQTQSVQEQITDTLRALRQCAFGVEVAVETRLVSLSPEILEFFQTKPDVQDKADGGFSLGLPFLSDIQVSMFLEAAQGDRRTTVMQVPKITVFSGQTASINIGDEKEVVYVKTEQVGGETVFKPVKEMVKCGVFAKINPVVSADRKTVRLHLDFNATNVDGVAEGKPQIHSFTLDKVVLPDGKTVVYGVAEGKPQIRTMTLDKVAEIPDGATVVYKVGRSEVELPSECGPPILSKIPYLNRLFTNRTTRSTTQDLYVLVTTRVIVHDEVESPAANAPSGCPIPR